MLISLNKIFSLHNNLRKFDEFKILLYRYLPYVKFEVRLGILLSYSAQMTICKCKIYRVETTCLRGKRDTRVSDFVRIKY